MSSRPATRYRGAAGGPRRRDRPGEVDQAASVASALRHGSALPADDPHSRRAIRHRRAAHPSRIVRSGRLPTLSRGLLREAQRALGRGRGRGAADPGHQCASVPALAGAPGAGRGPDRGGMDRPPRLRRPRRAAGRFQCAALFALLPADCRAVAGRATVNPFGEPQPTFHTRAPVLRLDHVFVTRSVEVVAAAPVRTRACAGRIRSFSAACRAARAAGRQRRWSARERSTLETRIGETELQFRRERLARHVAGLV